MEVLREAPQKPYTVVADFQASPGQFLFFTIPVTEEHMKKRAAEVGADAVIMVPAGGYYERGEIWAGRDNQAGTYSRMTATAIKYN